MTTPIELEFPELKESPAFEDAPITPVITRLGKRKLQLQQHCSEQCLCSNTRGEKSFDSEIDLSLPTMDPSPFVPLKFTSDSLLNKSSASIERPQRNSSAPRPFRFRLLPRKSLNPFLCKDGDFMSSPIQEEDEYSDIEYVSAPYDSQIPTLPTFDEEDMELSLTYLIPMKRSRVIEEFQQTRNLV